jgi:hypothetical protein
MEVLAQYLDDLEDFFYATALLLERLRRLLQVAVVVVMSFVVQFLGILLALSRPPLALAVVSLTVVTLLYRGATGKRRSATP